MTYRTAIALGAIALSLAACKREEPAPEPAATQTPPPPVASSAPTPEPEASPTAMPSAAATEAASEPAKIALDMGALNERRDPERVLRFYAEALRTKQWAAAARAWAPGMGVTAATLKAAYDRPELPAFTFGKATAEGAAGSLYYEAPVTLRFGPGAPPERGTLLLRRVNDVDGATPQQLRWHIEKSTIGAGQ